MASEVPLCCLPGSQRGLTTAPPGSVSVPLGVIVRSWAPTLKPACARGGTAAQTSPRSKPTDTPARRTRVLLMTYLPPSLGYIDDDRQLTVELPATRPCRSKC